MTTLSLTESFERYLAMEADSLKRIQELHSRVRRCRIELEAEIEATERLLAECEEM